VNKKRVQRLWRQAGLTIARRSRRKRVTGKGTGMPVKACFPKHVWCWDFAYEQLMDGTRIKFLILKDEFTREGLLLEAAYRMGSLAVIGHIQRVIEERGAPKYLRSDNGPEFVARALQRWLDRKNIKTIYIEPGCPWQNGQAESIISTCRDELFNREAFASLPEARVLSAPYLRYYNEERPHSRLDYLPPSMFAKKWSRRRSYVGGRRVARCASEQARAACNSPRMLSLVRAGAQR
jgi:putative transposase